MCNHENVMHCLLFTLYVVVESVTRLKNLMVFFNKFKQMRASA